MDFQYVCSLLSAALGASVCVCSLFVAKAITIAKQKM